MSTATPMADTTASPTRYSVVTSPATEDGTAPFCAADSGVPVSRNASTVEMVEFESYSPCSTETTT